MKSVLGICMAIAMLGLVSNVHASGDGTDGRGIRAGWQSSFISIGNQELDESSNGFYVGVFKSNNIGVSLLKLDSGIEYYQINGEANSDLNLNTELKLHYLSIPVSLRVKVGPVYGLAGLNGAVKLGGDYTFLGEDVGVSDISTFDAGAHLGVGVKFLMLGVEAKYTWGLVDMVDDYDSKTEYLQLGAVLFF
ncbi:outer membrane beta-barrel protein [Carboxylicivirga sp. RSCT41]|uniref:outer membrane beta-barrel protein n=1 Tax=Carboxylicivirga agarovorans TaxID=3417570 RepID=UPI003D337623